MKRILILGGGIGGTLVANLIARKLKKEEAEITLISASQRHIYQPVWLYIPFSMDDIRSASKPLRKLLNKRIKLVLGNIKQLDAEVKKVTLDDGQQIDYDFLVVATGSHPSPEDVPGFKEGAHYFYTEDSASRLRVALEEFRGGKIVVGVGGIPHKCPVAPLEFTFLVEHFLNKRNLRNKTEITYTYPLNRVFTVESAAGYAQTLLEQRNVQIETFFNLEEVDPENKVIRSMEGTELPYDLLVMIPPHRGAKYLQGNPIADEQGWVKTNRNTLEVKGFDNIWAMGDTTDIPISKAGSVTHFEAPVVAERLVAALRKTTPNKKHAEYGGKVLCFIETGYGTATKLEFDYQHPPKTPKPNRIIRLEKILFNKAYFFLVPTGRI